MLTCNNITKIFANYDASVTALNDVSIEANAGEFVAIKGASGSGKTTLLHICGTLQTPTSGLVNVSGQDPYQLTIEKRTRFRGQKIGFLFQRFYLLPYLNLEDNILLASVDNPTKKIRAYADELIATFGLDDRRKHTPDKLSAGECQRVGLARAMLNQPDLLLADEPTGNLDTKNSQLVLQVMSDYAASGKSVLMVTHSDLAASKASKVMTLEKGVFI